VIRCKVPGRPAWLEWRRTPQTEAAMEVLLLLLDEIDDLVLMVRQRAGMLFD